MPGKRIVFILYLSLIILASAVVWSEEGDGSATRLGIPSFGVDEAVLVESAIRVTMSYDATTCGNPWEGGIYGYGEIDKLLECSARVHFYEEEDLDRASALGATAKTWTGFSVLGTRLIYENAPVNTTHMVMWQDTTHRFDDSSPLSGSVEVEVKLPSPLKYLRERKTYHIVVIGDIRYSAFNGQWTNIAGLGPQAIEIGRDVDELSLRIEGPGEIDACGGGVTYELIPTGKDSTKQKVNRVEWIFSHFDGISWSELDTIEKSELSDLEIIGDGLGKLWSLATTHGTLQTGRYAVNARLIAKAYAGDDLLASSNTLSIRILAVEELELTVDGPETVDSQAEETTFTLTVKGEDETKGKVDGVTWIFSYIDAQGKWREYYWYREKATGNLKISRGVGGIADSWHDLVLQNGESVGGTKRLQMKLVARAKEGSRILGESDPHQFWITGEGLTIEANFSDSYDVYPTMPTRSRIEILYEGKEPIRLDVIGTAPAYLDIKFDPHIIEPEDDGDEDAGIYYSNLSITFDPSNVPGISLPRTEKIKFNIEGRDVEIEKEVDLKLHEANWLVMIFMAMDTKPDLTMAALSYLTDLSKVYFDKGSPEVGIMVLFDSLGKNNAELFSYEKDSMLPFRSKAWGPTNMSDATTLKKFVTESIKAMPAKRRLLMIDAHGAGIMGVVYDHNQGNSKHPMKYQPMLDALKGLPIDVIAFNCCLMAQMEVLHHISSLAPYLVASELIMPGTGLDLDGLFTALFKDSANIGGGEVSKLLVDEYKTRHDKFFRRNTTLSCIRSDKLASLASAIDGLAKSLLKGYGEKDADFNRTIADIGSKTEMVDGGYPYADIKDFAERLAADARIKSQALKEAANKVVREIDDAVIHEAENVWILKDLTFVKTDEDGYNGLSILLWNYRTSGDEGKVFKKFIGSFDQTDFSKKTDWGEFIEEYVRSVPRTTRAVHLKHLLHELHLHVYDQDGNHVGYNSSSTVRTPIDCEIPGALYSDLKNGTKIILLPEEVDEFSIVVDGQDMEEPEEPYTLTVTLVVEDEVVDVQEREMTIHVGANHRTGVEVRGNSLSLEETSIEGNATGGLPGWFRESFLFPLVKPILPMIPDPLLPTFPYLLIGLPPVIIIGAGLKSARSRSRTKDLDR